MNFKVLLVNPKMTTILILLFIGLTGFNRNENNNAAFPYINDAPINSTQEIIWHVKAFRPEAKLLKVKAIDKHGNIYDVKAIQSSDDTSILDVKAFVNGKRLPIKILMNEGNNYLPVKAIDENGTLIDIKAITDENQVLDIKGVSKSGNIVHIRAISEGGVRYNIISISPKGQANNVTGIKMQQSEVETTINGIDVFAHVKSIRQK
jgi:hypothetical protein